MTKPTFSELWERAMGKKAMMCCPDCDSVGTLSFADDTVLVCSSCNYSIDEEDLASEWLEILEEETGFND